MSERHLLIPKEFRVWCRPRQALSGTFDITTVVSKVTCAKCLTAYRTKTTGNRRPVTVNVARGANKRQPPERKSCAICGSYKVGFGVDGAWCMDCGSNDADE